MDFQQQDGGTVWNKNYFNVSQESSQDLKLRKPPFHWVCFPNTKTDARSRGNAWEGLQHSQVHCHVDDLPIILRLALRKHSSTFYPLEQTRPTFWSPHLSDFHQVPYVTLILSQSCLAAQPPLERSLILYSMHSHLTEIGVKRTL